MASSSNTNLEPLLYDDEFADFTITCGDKEFKVHRAILCVNSHFFQSVCTLPFQVRGQEVLGAEIEIWQPVGGPAKSPSAS
jgi:BTB/POZ domain